MAHHGQDDQPHRRRQGDALDAKIGFDKSDLKQGSATARAEWTGIEAEDEVVAVAVADQVHGPAEEKRPSRDVLTLEDWLRLLGDLFLKTFDVRSSWRRLLHWAFRPGSWPFHSRLVFRKLFFNSQQPFGQGGYFLGQAGRLSINFFQLDKFLQVLVMEKSWTLF